MKWFSCVFIANFLFTKGSVAFIFLSNSRFKESFKSNATFGKKEGKPLTYRLYASFYINVSQVGFILSILIYIK